MIPSQIGVSGGLSNSNGKGITFNVFRSAEYMAADAAWELTGMCTPGYVSDSSTAGLHAFSETENRLLASPY